MRDERHALKVPASTGAEATSPAPRQPFYEQVFLGLVAPGGRQKVAFVGVSVPGERR
jgi:hypothetical protein